MSYWTILKEDGSVSVMNINEEGEPDPTIYGGTSCEEQVGHLDPVVHVRESRSWSFDLVSHRDLVVRTVNSKADLIAEAFITPGARQAMSYLRKETEARNWSEGADPANFPFLSAEAEALSISLPDLVAEVIQAANAWIPVGKAIEARRRQLNLEARGASSREELDTIINTSINEGWP